VIDDVPASVWEQELEELFLRIGHRFPRVEPRRRMRDYVRGLLGPVGRKNSWQLAEFAGHPTPDGLQHLLGKSRWEADLIRDDLQGYVAEHLGTDEGILIIDDPDSSKTAPPPPGCNGSPRPTTNGSCWSARNWRTSSPPSSAACEEAAARSRW